MAILPICIVGEPVLHQQTELVELDDAGRPSDEIVTLLDDMYETMDAAHGVGLAANQVGVGSRVFVYDCPDGDRSAARRRGEVINPVLETSEIPETMPDPDDNDEGCLSVPGEQFPTGRAEWARVPWARTNTRIVPWQPASMMPPDGSPSSAMSPDSVAWVPPAPSAEPAEAAETAAPAATARTAATAVVYLFSPNSEIAITPRVANSATISTSRRKPRREVPSRVIAIDANPDLGTLAQRAAVPTPATIRDLLAARDTSRYAQVRAFTHQANSRLEVIGSERDPAVSEAFSEADYRHAIDILQHHYNVILTDCGTGLMHSAMAGVLDLANTLVLVTSPALDGAQSASATLDYVPGRGSATAFLRFPTDPRSQPPALSIKGWSAP